MLHICRILPTRIMALRYVARSVCYRISSTFIAPLKLEIIFLVSNAGAYIDVGISVSSKRYLRNISFSYFFGYENALNRIEANFIC